MSSFESEQREKLLEAMRSLGLDEKWIIAVAALCAQEIAVRKRLEILGEASSDEEFQVVADRLIETLKRQGGAPPEILMSLVRAHTKLRAKLVHHGHQTVLGEEEVNSLVTNTTDLLYSLYKPVPMRQFDTKFAEELLAIDHGEAVERLNKLKPAQRKSAILGLLAKYASFWSQPSLPTEWSYWDKNCRSLTDGAIINMTEEDITDVIDIAIRNFALSIPQRIMELLSFTCGQEAVRKMLVEKGHVGWVVTTFGSSNSYDNASINASIIISLVPLLTKGQIETVLDASLSNNQIVQSWGAQAKMRSLVAWAEGKVEPGLASRVQAVYGK